jgi:hypothetical protein
MANYYRVSPKFWPWARRRGLTDAQATLAFYLLTCEHRNLEGLYRLPKLYISADLGWPAKKVDENLAAVLATGFAEYDDAAEMLLIPKALKHQAPTTEKQIAGAIAQIERIPRSCLWNAFRMACESHCPRLAEAIEMRWPSDTDAMPVSRADAISSSNSSSSKEPPQPPEQARGEQDQQESASRPRKNSRLLGTSGRHRDREALAADQAHAAASAVDALGQPAATHHEQWTAVRAEVEKAVPGSTWGIWLEPVRLAAVEGDTLVIDGSDEHHAWLDDRFGKLIAACSETVGARVRLATVDEHEGFKAVAA